MATSHQSVDRFASVDSAESLSKSILEKLEKPLTDTSPWEDKDMVTSGSLRGSIYSANHCNSSAEAVHSGGCGNAADTLGAYRLHANNQRVEIVSHEFYGNGFNLQDFRRPCVPVTTQLPSEQYHGELYADDARHIHALDPSHYQYPNPNNVHSSSQFQNFHVNFPVNSGNRVDCRPFGPKENLMGSMGGYGRANNLFGSHKEPGFSHVGFENFWDLQSNCSKPVRRKSPFFPAAASLKHVNSPEWFGDDFAMASQLNGSYNNVYESSSSFSSKHHPHRQINRGFFHARVSSPNLENSHSVPTLNEGIQGGRCNHLFCSCTSTLDLLSERNRGPRSCMPRGKNGMVSCSGFELSKQCDFETDFEDGKFFVIKSYSEDNVYKSIKYGVWASTANGNKKLDAAYREAKKNECTCPVFLLFSVNASARFCGVAEMVGPVDFETSVEYWQQDKWPGHFPVKWHIIKDVPNSQFRHIILQNNDNKPVTNSRDTQEVGMEQGIEMLNILKNYQTLSSILDDFGYYEERQKELQQRKAGQRVVLEASAVPLYIDQTQTPTSLPCDLVTKMSKSFAETLVLNENLK